MDDIVNGDICECIIDVLLERIEGNEISYCHVANNSIDRRTIFYFDGETNHINEFHVAEEGVKVDGDIVVFIHANQGSKDFTTKEVDDIFVFNFDKHFNHRENLFIEQCVNSVEFEFACCIIDRNQVAYNHITKEGTNAILVVT